MIDVDKVLHTYPIGRRLSVLQEDGCLRNHIVQRYLLEEDACYIEMADGTRYHYEQLSKMEVKDAETEKITDTLRQIGAEICDHYCKYPQNCTSDEELEDHCCECPIVKL